MGTTYHPKVINLRAIFKAFLFIFGVLLNSYSVFASQEDVIYDLKVRKEERIFEVMMTMPSGHSAIDSIYHFVAYAPGTRIFSHGDPTDYVVQRCKRRF